MINHWGSKRHINLKNEPHLLWTRDVDDSLLNPLYLSISFLIEIDTSLLSRVIYICSNLLFAVYFPQIVLPGGKVYIFLKLVLKCMKLKHHYLKALLLILCMIYSIVSAHYIRKQTVQDESPLKMPATKIDETFGACTK